MHRKIINDKIENQEISIHRRRLWRSLYVCDCVSSVNLGRPLMINTYDYDDINYPVENYYLMKMIMSKEFELLLKMPLVILQF